MNGGLALALVASGAGLFLLGAVLLRLPALSLRGRLLVVHTLQFANLAAAPVLLMALAGRSEFWPRAAACAGVLLVVQACVHWTLAAVATAGVVRPIQRLSAGVARARATGGALDLGIASGDELGELARAFDLLGRALVERETVIFEANSKLMAQAQSLDRTAGEKTRQLEAILDSTPDGLVVIDDQERLVRLNHAALKILGAGLPAEGDPTWYGRYAFLRPDGSELSRFQFPLHRALGAEDPGPEECLYPVAGGPSKVLRVHASAVPGPLGTVAGAVALIRDVTREKEMERHLASSLEAVKAAYQAKSQFLAGMSHELRTPLNAVIGYTSIVLRKCEGLLPELQVRNLTRALSSAENLLALINDVLDLSKLESGRFDVNCESVDAGAVVEECVGLQEGSAHARGLSLEFVRGGAPAAALADPGRVRQIVLNLLSNAVKFTDRGRVVIRLLQEERFVRIDVTDTGIGISADGLRQIFQEFVQLPERGRGRLGTGLGLALSRRLARAMGGDLAVSSKEGAGSTFSLTLPVATQPPEGRGPGAA